MIEDAVAALLAPPSDLDETVAGLPGAPGLYAWWTATDLGLGGAEHDGRVLLDVGSARMLRNRIRRQDLYRTGVSRLRRVLAGLLLDDLGLAPTWAAEVVLAKADEERLTDWMRERLLLTALPDDGAAELVGPVVQRLGATALSSDAAVDAEQRFLAAAGEKPVRPAGEVFRRP
ncbi:GIY-YIG nuclease family protein [Actinomycetospora sp. OC33-EN08]|uniref:GIY-YIG nuclease family protein n=1 Tax=Actinomycetospora aurantiaca TaxID=3129233 RepID=A0ABU8MRD4_9PSEU